LTGPKFEQRDRFIEKNNIRSAIDID